MNLIYKHPDAKANRANESAAVAVFLRHAAAAGLALGSGGGGATDFPAGVRNLRICAGIKSIGCLPLHHVMEINECFSLTHLREGLG